MLMKKIENKKVKLLKWKIKIKIIMITRLDYGSAFGLF